LTPALRLMPRASRSNFNSVNSTASYPKRVGARSVQLGRKTVRPGRSALRSGAGCQRVRSNFVEMPSIAQACALLSQVLRDGGAELQDPAPDRLIGEAKTALGQQLLNVAVAQREPQIKPDRMLGDRWREAMAATGEGGHAQS
jgi:hypothetical protein